MVFSYWPPKKRKGIKLFTRESSQQAKEEREIFLGFLFNYYYYSKKSKLTESYTNFFSFFWRVIKHTRRKQEKEKKTSMDITVKKYEHRHLVMSVCEHKCSVGEKYVLPQA